MAPDVSVPQECQVRVSYKSVKKEGPTRVLTRVSRKGVLQECQVRVSEKKCQARVSYKSVK